MSEECKIYDFEVPLAETYYRHFVEKYITDNTDVTDPLTLETDVNWMIDDLKERKRRGELSKEDEELLKKAEELVKEAKKYEDYEDIYFDRYIKAYCLLNGHKTALLLWDEKSESLSGWYIIFDLDPSVIEKIKKEISLYENEIDHTLLFIHNDEEYRKFEDKCYYLEGGNPAECREEAERIFSRFQSA